MRYVMLSGPKQYLATIQVDEVWIYPQIVSTWLLLSINFLVFATLQDEFFALDEVSNHVGIILERIFSKAFERAKRRPALLVQAMMVVENQEKLDRSVRFVFISQQILIGRNLL